MPDDAVVFCGNPVRAAAKTGPLICNADNAKLGRPALHRAVAANATFQSMQTLQSRNSADMRWRHAARDETGNPSVQMARAANLPETVRTREWV